MILRRVAGVRPSPPGRSPRVAPAAVLLLLLLLPPLAGTPARAEDRPPSGGASAASGPSFGRGLGGVSGGLDGTMGIAATAVLAVLGVAVLAGARLRPPGGSGSLRVVGRAQLTGRQAVYLLRAGDRTLILGIGGQGPPTLLGELDAPDEPAPGAAVGRGRAGGKP